MISCISSCQANKVSCSSKERHKNIDVPIPIRLDVPIPIRLRPEYPHMDIKEG
jgi:hypothetical protein